MSTRADSPHDARIARVMDERLAARAPGKTICPSEVARALASGEHDAWRDWMDTVRRVAAARAAAGEIVVTQRGRPVDIEHARGPVRLGRPND